MKRCRRAYFTLLEVLIAIGVLALMAGVVAFNVRGFYFQQEALDEMNRVVNQLRTAQELMMLVNLDSEVRFKKDEEGLWVGIAPISAPPPSAVPLLKSEPLFLKHIEVSFDNAINDTLSKDQFVLPFISKGFVMHPGVMQLKGGGATRSIFMLGSPAPIQLQAGAPPLPPNSRDLFDYIEQVTQQTAAETQPTT